MDGPCNLECNLKIKCNAIKQWWGYNLDINSSKRFSVH